MSPLAGSSAGQEVLIFRPHRLRITATVIAFALCAVTAVGWLALPLSLRQTFTPFQRITLLAVLATMLTVVAAMAACSVRADAQGLTLRNGFRVHHIAWDRVHQILLRRGDPWAMVLIKPADGSPFEVDLDAEKRPAMGIQASDGERAKQAVADLIRRHQQYQGSSDSGA